LDRERRLEVRADEDLEEPERDEDSDRIDAGDREVADQEGDERPEVAERSGLSLICFMRHKVQPDRPRSDDGEIAAARA
jgi:hypothetical protein